MVCALTGLLLGLWALLPAFSLLDLDFRDMTYSSEWSGFMTRRDFQLKGPRACKAAVNAIDSEQSSLEEKQCTEKGCHK